MVCDHRTSVSYLSHKVYRTCRIPSSLWVIIKLALSELLRLYHPWCIQSSLWVLVELVLSQLSHILVASNLGSELLSNWSFRQCLTDYFVLVASDLDCEWSSNWCVHSSLTDYIILVASNLDCEWSSNWYLYGSLTDYTILVTSNLVCEWSNWSLHSYLRIFCPFYIQSSLWVVLKLVLSRLSHRLCHRCRI